MTKLKKLFRTRYRIVTDKYLGYEVQYRFWFVPFYMQIGFCNTHMSVERAEKFIKSSGKVVKYL